MEKYYPSGYFQRMGTLGWWRKYRCELWGKIMPLPILWTLSCQVISLSKPVRLYKSTVSMLCLYHQDMQSVQYEVNPLCVLDFYIHESRQRTGCGKKMFEHMLKVIHVLLLLDCSVFHIEQFQLSVKSNQVITLVWVLLQSEISWVV